MKQNTLSHVPVLLEESIEGLALGAGEVIVDGTFGGGGHTNAILDRFRDTVSVVCVDLDERAAQRYAEGVAKRNLHTTFVHANFKDVATILAATHLAAVGRVLLDLGTSTFQLLADERGFSFHSAVPLSMTFSAAGAMTGFDASTIVNEWDEASLVAILDAYGEERQARTIARAIVQARAKAPITTAAMLAGIISRAVHRRGRIHPATKTFQALRITVNDELVVLKEALGRWWEVLAPSGRIAVITFHSLEDRVVKQWMKQQSSGRVITKKPITPSREALLANPRSRSAKLRIIEKTNSHHD
ncbi:MAG TPA: 16S rRNA (cytosine(1402)-N(4))-methyltransferase RsmH [Candidatus Paceibacterota bacterium]|nr:16S rRNA (cytosine(1402)-N(4))-methyltransferase RsmH [Candidatus Paceibacterota bacterium]